MIKILAFSAVCLLSSQLIKNIKSEYAFFISLGGAILIFSASLGGLREIIDTVTQIAQADGNISFAIKILIKLFGVALITEFVCNMCDDAGERMLSSQTLLYSKIAMTVILLPLVSNLCNVVFGLINKI